MRSIGLSLVLALASSVQIAKAEVGTVVCRDGQSMLVPGDYWLNGKPTKYIVLLDLGSGKEIRRFGDKLSVQLSAAASPDGKTIAISGTETKKIGNPAAVKEITDSMVKSAGDNSFLQGFMEGAGESLRASLTEKEVPSFSWIQADTGNVLHRVNLGESVVNVVAFSPDGKTIAAGCSDSKVRLFDVSSAKLLRTLTGLQSEVLGLSFSGDGKRLAARDDTVKVWDLITGKIVRTFPVGVGVNHLYFTQSTALSPNGLYAAVGDGERKVEVWDMSSGKLIRSINDAKAFAFSPDSTSIAVGNEKGHLKLMNIATGQLKKTYKGLADLPYTDVFWLQFTKDGSKLVVGGGESVTKVFDVVTGNEAAMFTASNSAIRDVSFDRTGQTLLTGNDRGELRCVDPATGATKRLIRTSREARHVKFHPAANVIAVGGEGIITLYDVATGQPTCTIHTNADDLSCFQFSNDGKKIAAGFRSSVVRTWDAQSGHELFKLGSAPTAEKKEFSFSDLLNMQKHQEDTQKQAQKAAAESRHMDAIIELAFSPDDSLIATASADSTVRFWDANTGRFLRTLLGHKQQVNAAQFTPDGKRLVSGDTAGVIIVCDPQDGKALQTLQSPDGEVAAIGVVDGGQTIVTSTMLMDKPNFIRVIDINSGEVKKTIAAGTDYPNQIALTPNGKQVAASSIQGLIRIWDLSSGEAHSFEPQPLLK